MIRPVTWPSITVARYTTLYWGRVATSAYARALATSIRVQSERLELCCDLRELAGRIRSDAPTPVQGFSVEARA